MTWTAAEGTPSPLGVTWLEEEQALNFAVYSQHAESVTLLLYSEADLVKPVFAVRLNYLTNKSGPVWHCRVPMQSLGDVRYYAYSVSGPNPSQAHSFDPQKILLDPYARCVFFPPSFDRSLATREGSNAGKAPLGMIHAHRDAFDWGTDPSPRHESDAIVYELHVKGFTQNPNSGVDRRHAGAYAGLIDKIPYLKDLGVTVVELMPVYQRDPQERELLGLHAAEFLRPAEHLLLQPRGASSTPNSAPW